MTETANDQDRRVMRTRDLVFRGFLRLVFERRYDEIRTVELIAEAGVGRSTFYEHFRGKEDVLLAVMDPILLPLASAASGRADQAVLRPMLEHLWARRALGRIILDSTAGPKLRQKLAAMIEARLAIEGYGPPPLAFSAAAAAVGQLTVLRMWIAGEASCSVDGMARQLMAFSKLVGQPNS